MTKLKLSIAGAIVVAGILAALTVRHRAQVQLRERDEAMRRQAQTLASLTAENERLSHLVEQAKSAQPLSQDQLRELLRLRSQVGQLHQAVAEKAPLAAKQAKLKAAVVKSEKHVAEEQAAANYWPKDQLAFAGYTDPESAMKSLLWAMKSADVSSWQTSCTPEARAKLEKEWDKHGKSETERVAELRGMADALISGSTGFRIVDQKMTSPDMAIVNLSFVGEDRARKFVLKRVDGEWKFHDIIFSGQRVPEQ